MGLSSKYCCHFLTTYITSPCFPFPKLSTPSVNLPPGRAPGSQSPPGSLLADLKCSYCRMIHLAGQSICLGHAACRGLEAAPPCCGALLRLPDSKQSPGLGHLVHMLQQALHQAPGTQRPALQLAARLMRLHCRAHHLHLPHMRLPRVHHWQGMRVVRVCMRLPRGGGLSRHLEEDGVKVVRHAITGEEHNVTFIQQRESAAHVVQIRFIPLCVPQRPRHPAWVPVRSIVPTVCNLVHSLLLLAVHECAAVPHP
mmetsp:Transcript_26069/g.56922  ORF Transcript_26069/g.56922 Transcript_26069/m.56922 type:complete len:254 (-) Transcript_26069:833-1594(-)